MLVLVLGLVLFLGMHSVLIVNPGIRARVVASKGEGAWMGSYTAVSIVGLVLTIWGYGLARHNPTLLYVPPAGLRHLALLLMLPVFPLLIATYFPGRIKAAVRHPMLIAVLLWAAAHLMANGMLADLVLFGSFLVWAALDLASMRRRTAKPVPALKARGANDIIAVVGGLLVYGLFIGGLHRWLIGVAPI